MTGEDRTEDSQPRLRRLARHEDEVYLWVEQESSIVLKAATADGGPVKLTLGETHDLVHLIIKATVALSKAKREEPTGVRFYDLGSLAKRALGTDPDEARSLAEELLRLASEQRDDWNFGNAIHVGNTVLGQVALREGKVDEAEAYLLASGSTPGSPQLDSFGPNMSLAKELLEAERSERVLEYLELCSRFWKNAGEQLEFWGFQVGRGKVPDFGANLLY